DRLPDHFCSRSYAAAHHTHVQHSRPCDAPEVQGGLLMASVAPNINEIRAIIARHKRRDLIFAICGIVALMIGVLTFAALFADMAIKGITRLDADFFTNFPSRKPERAGILSAWVGSTLVMLVTAGVAVALGVAAGIYLEEYAPQGWRAGSS